MIMSEAERAFRRLSFKPFWKRDHDWIFGSFRLKYFGNSTSKQLDLNTDWSKNLPDTYMHSVQIPVARSWRQKLKLAAIHKWLKFYKIRSMFPRNDLYDLEDRYGKQEWQRLKKRFVLRVLLSLLVLYWLIGWMAKQWRAVKRYWRAKENLRVVRTNAYERVRQASRDTQGELDYSLLPYTAATSSVPDLAETGQVYRSRAAATSTSGSNSDKAARE